MIAFKPVELPALDGALVYVESEYSLDFAMDARPTGGRSLLVNDLQLEIDTGGRVLYPWGLCPSTVHVMGSRSHRAAGVCRGRIDS